MSKIPLYLDEVNTAFEYLLEEYLNDNSDVAETLTKINNDDNNIDSKFDLEEEEKVVAAFLETPCHCSRNCKFFLNYQEVIKNRAFFRSLEKKERNYILLNVLKILLSIEDISRSGRTKNRRERKKFNYCVSIDRPVCKAVFLFYYGETSKRLDRLKSCVTKEGLTPPIHGNSGKTPTNAYNISDRKQVKSFILNFAAIHGLPDPGRDNRAGKGKLRILLPSVMTYKSVHQEYSKSIKVSGESPIAYRTFLKIWQDEFSSIRFNNPRSDLCMTCEDFKKRLNQITATLDDEKEKRQAKIHKEALAHLKHVKKERLFYQANIKVAKEYYKKLVSNEVTLESSKPNSRNIMAHYSWDFAQQLQYPFEEQQVGPIFFKTPRKAQLFGICSEGIPRQYNYLIDEEHSFEKNANTVISLLDHFFTNHSLGEKWVHLTADNCVGQNKNNALIQYLMYRVLVGLHDKIGLSFLVVGHTKFSPDAYFGLIKRYYRRTQVYTYEQLVHLIESSSKNGHNVCIPVSHNKTSSVIYRDWSSWLSQYFETLKGITNYNHFVIEPKNPSIIIVKEHKDSKELKINLTKKKFPFSKLHPPKRLPKQIFPKGLSLERQWYLYDKIRCHIPVEKYKNETCPKPKRAKT
ncbi:hypothetical protein PN36_33745 [Candidatus Thiomargarita nelsonii]|uniref:DUF7869 domain-containing protein n=1 Tax=Candidatus Thiomargarita nelsonii TaxID=1003181 RepID=A0A0A6RM92_9GAMM|nr:hypothetical protein PN36_33745 [Candidatus Thiomargarita nelsonii]